MATAGVVVTVNDRGPVHPRSRPRSVDRCRPAVIGLTGAGVGRVTADVI